jgi:hypothetical protein
MGGSDPASSDDRPVAAKQVDAKHLTKISIGMSVTSIVLGRSVVAIAGDRTRRASRN